MARGADPNSELQKAKSVIEEARACLTEIHIRNKGYADQQEISRMLADQTAVAQHLRKRKLRRNQAPLGVE